MASYVGAHFSRGFFWNSDGDRPIQSVYLQTKNVSLEITSKEVMTLSKHEGATMAWLDMEYRALSKLFAKP